MKRELQQQPQCTTDKVQHKNVKLFICAPMVILQWIKSAIKHTQDYGSEDKFINFVINV